MATKAAQTQGELKANVKKEIELFLKNESLELKNLEIFDCNAYFGGPFTSADLRMPFLGIESSLPSDPPGPWSTYMYSFDEVFNRKVLEMLLDSDDNKKDIHDDLKGAYKALMEYIAEIERHQACLKKVVGLASSNETDIAYVLAVHLFAPLCSSGSCVIDAHSRFWPKSCPCGCGKCLQKGSTGIGDIKIWHGYSDILINQIIPMKMMVKDTSIGAEESTENENAEEPEISDDNSCSLSIEVKKDVDFHNMKRPVCQVIAQTITNAFAQVNRNQRLSKLLIPSFGCSGDTIMIFAYDPVNDTLVKSTENIKLWMPSSSGNLCTSSVVHIWLYINFINFMLPSLAERYETKKSNFHKVQNIDYFWNDAKCGLKGFPNRGFIDSDYSMTMRPRKKIKLGD